MNENTSMSQEAEVVRFAEEAASILSGWQKKIESR